ncbi:hypothetical protein Vadar_025246 [Vaccinium darrowii]|uniref:Uncharacterized protein n=1 Tax=Vaccinium darrowii TaxID=229202 RepID=A0ACB7X3L7_9ERIC|nr:hypothetical protein Vadar_025246 [Vaccinium darrowii]
MGFVGFLMFAFKCFDLLAWYASIRAIENNSNSEMRNLVAYWILFSLVSLFELAFAKLIQWLPFWSYMKLMAMCLLVLPDFNGASYVYECLLRPCLSVDLRVVIKYFIRPKEDKSLNAENFLSMAERYVQENGSEALEKLLDRKSKHTKPDIGVEEIKAMTNTEERETAAAIQSNHTKPDIGMEEIKAMTNTEEKETPVAIQSNYEEPIGEEPIAGKVDARAVEPPEKTPVAATKLSQVKEPSVGKENANMGQLKDKNPAVATEQVKCVEPNLAQNEKKTVDAGEIKEKTGGAAGGENKAMETTGLEKVQREWTCALCQVRTTCEKNLHSHLQGRRHMEKRQELKASMQMNKTKCSSSSAASPEPRKTHNVDRLYDNRTKNQQYNVQVNRTNDQCRDKQVDYIGYGTNKFKFSCSICDVKLISEIDWASHLRGQRHLFNTQQRIIDNLGGGYH